VGCLLMTGAVIVICGSFVPRPPACGIGAGAGCATVGWAGALGAA
jgi:hypothetical protein